MAQFKLPANSVVGKGTVHPAPQNATKTRTFHIYRWNPDDGRNPRVRHRRHGLAQFGNRANADLVPVEELLFQRCERLLGLVRHGVFEARRVNQLFENGQTRIGRSGRVVLLENLVGLAQ